MQALELASLQTVLTFLVILSYAVVVLVTVKSRRTTVELQQLVLELRAKELGKIKSAVVPQVPLGPPSILVGAPLPHLQPAQVRRAVVRPAPSVARPIPTAPAAAPQRRVVHEKIEVTKRRRIEESTPGVPGSEEIIEEEEEVETRPTEIRMEEPVVVTTRSTRAQESPVVVAPEPPPPTVPSRDITPLRYIIRSTEPPLPTGDSRAKVLKDDPIARKGREALRQQLLEARGRSGKIHEILESQLKKGVISKQTYKELMERVGPPPPPAPPVPTAPSVASEPPAEARPASPRPSPEAGGLRAEPARPAPSKSLGKLFKVEKSREVSPPPTAAPAPLPAAAPSPVLPDPAREAARRKAFSLLSTLTEQYKSGVLSEETYRKSKATLEERLQKLR